MHINVAIHQRATFIQNPRETFPASRLSDEHRREGAAKLASIKFICGDHEKRAGHDQAAPIDVDRVEPRVCVCFSWQYGVVVLLRFDKQLRQWLVVVCTGELAHQIADKELSVGDWIHDEEKQLTTPSSATGGAGAAPVRCSAWLAVADVLVPVIGLGCCLDYSVALDEERLHVAREEKKVGDAAKVAERRLEAEYVAHGGATA